MAINLESDFGFMQSAVIGIAVLVPARPRRLGRRRAGHLQSMTAATCGYERSVVALGMARARIGEARGDPDEVLAALDPVRRFADRDAVDEPGFWPWQDLYADALVAVGRARRGRRVPRPHEKLRRAARPAHARSPGWPGPAVGSRQRRADRERGTAAFDRGAGGDRTGCAVPFERARIELAAGRVPAPGRAAPAGRRPADAPPSSGSPASAPRPTLERCDARAGRVGPGHRPRGTAGTGPG